MPIDRSGADWRRLRVSTDPPMGETPPQEPETNRWSALIRPAYLFRATLAIAQINAN